MTQHEMIRQFINENGSISPMEAFPLGITKLATRISEMRRDGEKIKIDTVSYKAADGTKKTYARYSAAEGRL